MSETIKVGAKVISLIEQAGKDGVNVLGFPELFTQPYLDNTAMFHEYMANSLIEDSPEMVQICEAVKKAGIFIVLGYSERDGDSLYIAQSFIDPTGTIVLHRRKIKPTGVERAIWGDGNGLVNVVDSPFGRIGGLNCWEHFQPLLRYHEYSQGVDIHVAGWPPFFARPENIPILYTTTGEGDCLACQFMAMEGACFVIVSTQVIPHVQTPGGGFAMIFGPDGTPLVDPLDSGEEGILTADIQLNTMDYAKHMLDVFGHYSRPDLLSLNVNLKPAKPVHYA
ncbi:nitrilase [Trichoderma aethiopicum]